MDLLLIIVFAQFLDVRETTQRETASLRNERLALTAQIERERSELAGIREALQSQHRLLQQRVDSARASRDEAIEKTESRLAEMETAMKMIGRWFDLEAPASDVVTSPVMQPSSPEAEVDPVASAIAKASDLGRAAPDAMVRFLIGHAELLKRAEIWTVHADDDGNIGIDAGAYRNSFRLEGKTQAARTAEVTDRLFASYKQFPEPKGLVILLISYAPQSVAGVYQPLIDAIPQTLERLRADTPQTRFEYTVLGPTPDPHEGSGG